MIWNAAIIQFALLGNNHSFYPRIGCHRCICVIEVILWNANNEPKRIEEERGKSEKKKRQCEPNRGYIMKNSTQSSSDGEWEWKGSIPTKYSDLRKSKSKSK